MTDSLGILTQWLAGGDGGAQERGTYASLTLKYDSVCFTQVEDRSAQTLRDHIYVSAFPLAEWLVHNW